MPRFLSPEVKPRVRELYEGTALTHAQIAARTGVGASTVSVLAEKEGWTRHPARRSPQLRGWKRAAIVSLREAGAPAGVIAEAAGCHRNTVGRIAPLRRPAATAVAPDAATEAGFRPVPAPVPAHLADLHAALMKPELRKAEAAPLLLRAAAALGAEALLRQDPQVERTAQVLARLAERIAALPDEGPYAGRGAADACRGAETFEETNALLEELVQRLGTWGPVEEDAEKAEAAARALDDSEAEVNLH